MPYCEYCGKQLFEITKFCSSCGVKINETIFLNNDTVNKTIVNNEREALCGEHGEYADLIIVTQFDESKLLKYGFIDYSGNWVIPPKYDSVEYFDNKGYSKAELNNKFGFINIQGHWIIPPIFDTIEDFDDLHEPEIAIAQKDEKFGLINRNGQWLVNPKFDCIDYFDDEGYSIAGLNGKFGFINKQGQWIVSPLFDSLEEFDDEGYSIAKLDEKYGLINRKGQWVVQPNFDYIEGFRNNGLAKAELNEKYGFINRQGQWIVRPQFSGFTHKEVNRFICNDNDEEDVDRDDNFQINENNQENESPIKTYDPAGIR